MIIEAGAVGINLEDTVHGAGQQLHDLPTAVARVRAAREAAHKAGVPIVINARTDVFLLGIGEKATRFDDAVRRLNAYREAGADCLYPIGLFDVETIGRLVKGIDGPINMMGLPGTPPAAGAAGSRTGQHRIGSDACGNDSDAENRGGASAYRFIRHFRRRHDGPSRGQRADGEARRLSFSRNWKRI